ncbi:UNVERIFIED_ORG: purine-cytosine permease-like protein [Pseudomonas reinekei]|nr:purine-cytosine permease-like protein [Pseudomonas reinekei]
MSIQLSTYSPDVAVPTDKRVFGGRDLFSLWFSLGIGLMVLQTGALLAPGLGLSRFVAGDFPRHPGRRSAAGGGRGDWQ